MKRRGDLGPGANRVPVRKEGGIGVTVAGRGKTTGGWNAAPFRGALQRDDDDEAGPSIGSRGVRQPEETDYEMEL